MRKMLLLTALVLTASHGVEAQPQGNLNYQNGFDDGHGLGVYQDTVDSEIRSEEPGANFGGAAFLWVDGPPPTRQILIRFDGIVGNDPGQIPPGSHIVAADLVLVASDVADSQTGDSHNVHQLLQPWDAATLTWQSPIPFGGDGIHADGTEATPLIVSSPPGIAANQTIRLDVSDAVANWVMGAPNHGLAILPGGSDGFAIRSAEDPVVSNRPLLEITAGSADCFADAVESFSPISVGPDEPHPLALHPGQALGEPDYESANPCQIPGSEPCRYATLGRGGSITLRFVDNALTGSGGPETDLWIFEVGPDVEDTFVQISDDGVVWQDIGKVFGSTSAIDIDAFGFGPESSFTFVRLTDDPNEGDQTGVTVGADIDAICALSSTSVSPVPSLRPFGIASLAVLITVLTLLWARLRPQSASYPTST